jgi:ABC-type antimicrobial peptide transport system permease subunit
MADIQTSSIAAESVSPWSEAWQRFRRNRMAVIGGVVFAAIAIAAIVGPWLVFHYNGED